jgi:lysophospholipase L1-like esterase
MRIKRLLSVAACLAVVGSSAGYAAPKMANVGAFPFHNGDRVVFLGDSITEQRLYTTYLETYLLTRFPDWKLWFRNAGWGGDTSWLRQRGLPPEQALQRDVLSLKPTVVTIDFSMNDAGYGAFSQSLYDQHVKGEEDLVKWIKQDGAVPIVLTVSPFEKKELGDPMEGYNAALDQFAAGDRMVAEQAHVPFADQFHPFVDAIRRERTIDQSARISGDTVHPGPPGHLIIHRRSQWTHWQDRRMQNHGCQA